jgi:hypothetical protein
MAGVTFRGAHTSYMEPRTGTGIAGSDGSYGICPAATVLTSPRGTIHDDENAGIDCTTDIAQCGSSDAGYGDDLNCFTTIHAPSGNQVMLTFTQMNLEVR